MRNKSVELQLVMQCAPVITGIKTSNLFIVSRSVEEQVKNILDQTNLAYYKFLHMNGKVVFLLYRENALAAYLKEEAVQVLLKQLGYTIFDLDFILKEFKGKYEKHRHEGAPFPHEMGILLGYPLEDVIGFMKYKGKHSLYCGYWKVRSEERRVGKEVRPGVALGGRRIIKKKR